ncbi:hypothetical protein JAAARDRAFT_141730 [Jaapia argillacea MUCL 33604]|uniref:Fungal pheromone STE3G-protein-coupled receptor n=1 Tax=Jaapia argillacea MUCL 33604 TaxID=933084 RepID=A0A067PJH2_9AGAM|nr:hypothetical protein JAAARDRAFT_141730 [Jaapia argillacea MUCL 33604]
MIDQLPNQVFTAFSFLGFILVLIPLPWQLEAWNIGCCCYIFWTAAQSLMLFINSIIWHHNVVNRAPVWCDIAVRLEVASAVAYSASSLCINRRFYKILQGKQPPRPSKWNIPREVVLDLCIGVGIPCLQIPLFYVVQLDRFDIYEDYGCYVDIYVSALAYSLVIVWPLAISIISAGYCAGTIYRLTRHQINLNTLLSGHNNLTRKTYIRIMAFAGVELIGGIPLSSWVLYNALKTYGAPAWVSWSYAHSADSVVQQIPASVWKVINPNHEFDRWMTVACAYIFFAFFGMWSEKAWEHYRLYYRFVAKRCPSISFSFPRFRLVFLALAFFHPYFAIQGLHSLLHKEEMNLLSRHTLRSVEETISSSLFVPKLRLVR